MEAFELAELTGSQPTSGAHYREFVSVPAMSAGVYTLEAGSTDPQHPHSEDEIYYVIAGRGAIRVAGEDRPVMPGSIVFVPAHTEHRFHTITESLTVLVIFAPSEGSQSHDD